MYSFNTYILGTHAKDLPQNATLPQESVHGALNIRMIGGSRRKTRGPYSEASSAFATPRASPAAPISPLLPSPRAQREGASAAAS